MKNVLLLLILLLSNFYTSQATHNHGGVITYRHISGTTYEATVTTYTKESSPADRPKLLLFWGDGSSDSIPRINGDGVLITPEYKMNVYAGTHTYTADGNYSLYIEDPNRNAGIINIPNSVNEPLHIQSQLIIGNFTANNSAVYSGIPIFDATLSDTFAFNFGFYDPDADILTYELVAPKGISGEDINGYEFPEGMSINNVTGEVQWINPTQMGEFVFTIKVNECRNNEQLGFVTFDIQCTVSNLAGLPLQFPSSNTWNMDNNGNYSYVLQPGQNFELPVTAINATSLVGSGEPFIAPNTAILDYLSSETDRLFQWQPTVARCSPYSAVFRANADAQRDITVLFYVREPNMQYCDTLCDAALTVKDVDFNSVFSFFPNPASTTLTIHSTTTNPQILKIINMQGQLVTLSVVEGQQTTIDISALQNGLYHLLLEDKQGRVAAKKFVVAR